MKPEIWSQVKNLTADRLMNALVKDGWLLHPLSGGSMRVFKKGNRMAAIHYHAKKSYGPAMLKLLFEDTGWTEADLKRLKLIK